MSVVEPEIQVIVSCLLNSILTSIQFINSCRAQRASLMAREKSMKGSNWSGNIDGIQKKPMQQKGFSAIKSS